MIITDSDDEALVNTARSRIAPLKKLVDNTKGKVVSTLAPVDGKISDEHEAPQAILCPTLISYTGPSLARTVIKHVQDVLEPESIDVVIDEEAINEAGLTLDRRVRLACDRVSAGDLLLTTLNPIGLTYRYREDERLVEIIPAR
jgi:hypothetical protein